MSKIYKVKKNAAGNSVACSEFAKGHAKKAVCWSLGRWAWQRQRLLRFRVVV